MDYSQDAAEQAAPNAPPAQRLADRIREACRVRHYSLSTEKTYVAWYKRFVRWAGLKHPATLGGDVVERWLSHLATEHDVAASTQRQAKAAILFLYKQVLGIHLPWLDGVVSAKQPQRLPCVLTQIEVQRLLALLPDTPTGLVIKLLYGTGMRISEALRLRVKDIDFAGRSITVREGKGDKDRITMLPGALADELLQQLAARDRLHSIDKARGMVDVEMPHALGRKYPKAGSEWGWQYVFATPGQAEELAKKAVGDYLTACGMTDQVQIGNYLMKLASVVGVVMANAEGSEQAYARMLGTAQFILKTMPKKPATLRPIQ